MNFAAGISRAFLRMLDRREMTRAATRQRRALAMIVASEKEKLTFDRVATVTSKARGVVAHKGFVAILHSLGVQTLPRCLSPRKNSVIAIDGESVSEKETLNEAALEFVFVWKFLFPLLDAPEVVSYLEEKWPGFILELKDTFIMLVVDGPFLHAMSGHRGRRHGAGYHAGSRVAESK